jgi:Carboxypeptidase regulatory-like domain/TonB dependent receptor/TonB-dependent Receptor Plug Domain
MKLKDIFLSIAMAATCLSLVTVGSSSAWAQQAAGAITGTVTDPAGSALPNVTVTARDIDRGTTWTTKSSSAGIYEFPQIPVGSIQLKVEAPGFNTEIRNSFVLVLNQVARIDFHLQIGKVSETVNVEDTPPLLQTASTELGTVIDAKTTTSLPLSTRDINQLTLLVPGVVSPNIFAFQSPQTTFGTGRPYVNGAREQDNNFTLDGMDVNQADNNDVAYVPGPDAVQEFNIITSNAPADFGNYIGGVIVETLKSGTNHYHGDIFEFLRNTDLNANSWENNALGAPRNPLQWNEFGGTVGGPILRDKLFFFADVQASLYNTPANTIAFSPIPAAFRTGDFSSICTTGFTGGLCNTPNEQLYDPASSATAAGRTPFLNNQVPIRSAAATSLLASSLFPSASTTSYLQHNYVNTYQGDLKIDWQASKNDHLMGRYSQEYTVNNTTNSLALIPSLTREYPLKNFVLDYAHVISPTLVNEARFGFQDFPANDQQYTNSTGQNLPVQFGIPGVQDSVLPALLIGPYSQIGNADLVEIFHDTTLEAEDSLTWTHGKHVIHGGFEYFHYLMNDLYPGNEGVAGQFTFSGQFTGNSALGTSGGNPVADFLLGLPEEVQEGSPSRFHLRNTLVGAFVQDHWQITRNLNLDLGLRYELTTPRGDKDTINNVNFDLVTGAPELGTNYATYTGKDNFQPRVGFAWQPDFMPHSVIRGAYDISTYMEGNGVNNMAVVNPPNVVTRDEINLGLTQPLTTLDQGYASFPAAACTAVTLDQLSPACVGSGVTLHETNPKLQPAVDQQWNLTVQHQLGGHTTASIGYVGNKIDHMSDIILWNQNQLLPGGAIAPGPYSQSLIQAGASVRYNDSSAFQTYNALELVIAQRSFHGLDLQASYTWSKCLTNSLGYFGAYGDEEGTGQSQTNGTYNFFQNTYNEKADYGHCITDTPQNFDGYVLYDLPFGKGRQFANSTNAVVDKAIGGWAVATNFTFHSGFSINPAGPDESGTGSVDARPDCVPGVSQYANNQFANLGGSLGKQFLNPAAVSLPAAGTFGNCQVGAFRGPGLKTDDLNITKTIPITERFNLLFMTQFINLTNTPIWGVTGFSCGPLCNGAIQTGPAGGSSGAGNFGFAQSQDPGRQIQFALKLNY